jgi:hypothetical protein
LPLDNEFITCPKLLLHARASIHACQIASWHIAIIKVDGEIYKGILEPLLVEVVNKMSKRHQLNIESIVVSDKEEEEEEEIPTIVPWITFCK